MSCCDTAVGLMLTRWYTGKTQQNNLILGRDYSISRQKTHAVFLTAPLAAEGAPSCLTDSCHPLSKVRERGEKENMKARRNTTVPSMTTALDLGIAQPVPRRTRDVDDGAIPMGED